MTAVLKRATEIVNDAYKHRCEPFEDIEGNVTYKPLSEYDRQGTLVFPRYFHSAAASESEKTRISEQELRFAFVQAFNELVDNYFYGIEVPTKDRYRFNDENGKINPTINENGRSGSFDMVIYDDRLRRVGLIEFKASYPDAGYFAKDFLKLANPVEDIHVIGIKSYFIHIVKNFSSKKIISRIGRSNCTIQEQITKKGKRAILVNYVPFSLYENKEQVQQYNIMPQNINTIKYNKL